MTPAEAIIQLKMLSRTAQKISGANVDEACDMIGALLNHEAELKASVETLLAQKEVLKTEIAAASAEHRAHLQGIQALKSEHVTITEQTKQVRKQLEALKANIGSLLA